MSGDGRAPQARLLLVAPVRYSLPLDEPLERKFAALSEVFDLRVVARAPAGRPTSDEIFRLSPPFRPRFLDGLAFFLMLPARVARELRLFRPHAVLVQGTHATAAVLLARALARSHAKVVLDVHGDWGTATRLYGSPVRRLLAPVGDRMSTVALRRADAIRTISDFTTGLVRRHGREPAGVFPAYVDLASFVARPPAPLPERPQALFIGVLERYKNVDGLAAAWRLAAPRVPGAVLRIVGTGRHTRTVERLVADLPEQTVWTPALANPEVAEALDEASVLVLPSRSEGLPRVVMEAFCRGRGVIGARAGGIPDLVEDGRNGILVDPENAGAIADALVRVLSDPALAHRLGTAAAASAEPWLLTPAEFADRVHALIERVTSETAT